MLDRGLCDYFITGEAEVAIVELICRNNPEAVGINRPPKQIQNLEGLAFANYEDCNHELYPLKLHQVDALMRNTALYVLKIECLSLFRYEPPQLDQEYQRRQALYHQLQQLLNLDIMS